MEFDTRIEQQLRPASTVSSPRWSQTCFRVPAPRTHLFKEVDDGNQLLRH